MSQPQHEEAGEVRSAPETLADVERDIAMVLVDRTVPSWVKLALMRARMMDPVDADKDGGLLAPLLAGRVPDRSLEAGSERMREADRKINSVLIDVAVRDWVKQALQTARSLDPGCASRDAERIAALLRRRCDAVLSAQLQRIKRAASSLQ